MQWREAHEDEGSKARTLARCGVKLVTGITGLGSAKPSRHTSGMLCKAMDDSWDGRSDMVGAVCLAAPTQHTFGTYTGNARKLQERRKLEQIERTTLT